LITIARTLFIVIPIGYLMVWLGAGSASRSKGPVVYARSFASRSASQLSRTFA
jgi:hypothetical protein